MDSGGIDRGGRGGGTAGQGGTGGAAAGSGGSGGAAGTAGGSGGALAGSDGGVDAPEAGNDGGGVDGAAPTCTDGVKNSDETGIDCGGHCGKCGPGVSCLVNADCQFSCRADKTCASCNVAADCSGIESECEHRTCTAGVCGSTRSAAGTILTVQTTGDCKRRQCAADGTVASVNDDTDVPEDRNPCTNDLCTPSGTPSHTTLPADTNCGGANRCNANGQCVGCAVAADCPGNDTTCRTRTCSAAGVCGFNFTAAGTKLTDPTTGDCKGMQCDGAGNPQVFNDNADLPVDGNICTTDECSSGTPSHRPTASGTTCGSSLVCDGASHCVQCLSASTCPGTDAECHTRSCVAGACGTANTANGTPVAAQTPRDCKRTVCNGQGTTAVVSDDLDLPVDGNPCTQDVCTTGTPSHPFVSAGNSCGANTICDGQGACVTCISPTSCPGTDTDCRHRTCINGACGMANMADGTAVPNQMTGDCKKTICMTGASLIINDDLDLPVDGNLCTSDVCTTGVATNPNLASGTTCGTNLMCNGQGACVGCLTAATCGTDTTCQTHTCTNGTCGVNNAAVGTLLPAGDQTMGDCKKVQCDGQGQSQTVNDDNDLPVDGITCTKDVCTGGLVSHPPEPSGTACSQNNGNKCNSSGACVQCFVAADCGADTACRTFACSASGQCSSTDQPDDTLVDNAPVGNCHTKVCKSGLVTDVVNNSDVNVDGNPCTDDVCMAGTASNPNRAVGFDCGPGLVCNGTGMCVGCLMDSDCPAPIPANACQTPVCVLGACMFANVAAGTPLPSPPGDCNKDECDGNGQPRTVNDDNDLPVDGITCTQDVCSGGVPSHPPVAAGATCTGPNNAHQCDGLGACVECLGPTECPDGPDSICHFRTCDSGFCGVTEPTDETTVTTLPPGDCQKIVCDGAGGTQPAADDSDGPANNNQCALSMCMGGAVMTTNRLHGTTCDQDGGRTCTGGGACMLTVNIVRVGFGGATALSNVASPVVLEERRAAAGGLMVGIVGLPQDDVGPNPTDNKAFTLSGTANTQGNLTLSGDGRYVVLAGYNRAVGSTTIPLNVGNSLSADTPRMAARVAANGSVNTTTLFGSTAFNADNIRGAASNDGTGFWLSGASNPAGTGGVWYADLGASTGTQLFSAPANMRCLGVQDGKLYGTSNTSPNVNVFQIGSGLPTSGPQTVATLTGMAGMAMNPFSFAFFDMDADGVADRLYVANEGGSVRGIQRWNRDSGGNWGTPTTITFTVGSPPVAVGLHGVTGFKIDTTVTLITTTEEGDTTQNQVVVFVDTGSGTPTGTSIATAPANTRYRGVALSPHL